MEVKSFESMPMMEAQNDLRYRIEGFRVFSPQNRKNKEDVNFFLRYIVYCTAVMVHYKSLDARKKE